MAKLTTNDVTGGYADVTAINENNTLIETAVENTLSRDGTTPNSMAADLDMDSNDIINVDAITANTISVDGVDVTTFVANSQAYAEEWANKAEDSLVSTAAGGDGVDDYSAMHHATKASASEVAAALSETNVDVTYDLFDDRILGAFAADPTLDNDGDALLVGTLYFLTVTNSWRGWNGTGWSDVVGSSTAETYEYTATAGQTTFTGSDDNSATMLYQAGFVTVSLNGRILHSNDYTSTSGTSIILASGANVSDVLSVLAFGTFDIVDVYTKAQTYTRDETIHKTSLNGSATMPTGTTAQRDGTPLTGYLRHNTDYGRAEEYDGTSWKGLGGAAGASGDAVFYENGQTVTTSYTLTANTNAHSQGPITINAGATVTIPTGATWGIS